MPLYKKFSGGKIFLWRVSETLTELKRLYLASKGDITVLKNFSSGGRKIERMVVYLLIESMLDDNFRLDYKENGAPFLVDSNQSISISHTKGYVGVALTCDQHIGIDLQHKDKRLLKLQKHFMSLEELRILEGLVLDREELLIYLLLYWSAKEAAFKYFQPEIETMTDISILPFRVLGSKGIIYAYPKGCRDKQTKFYYLFFDDCVLVSSLPLEE